MYTIGSPDEAIVQVYEAVVREAGADGIELNEAKTRTVERFLAGGIEFPAEDPRKRAEREFARLVTNGVRKARADNLSDLFEYVVDAIISPEIASITALTMLEEAYRVGATGRDKTLREWTLLDLISSMNSRQQNAAHAAASAAEFTTKAAVIIQAMQEQGVEHLGELREFREDGGTVTAMTG